MASDDKIMSFVDITFSLILIGINIFFMIDILLENDKLNLEKFKGAIGDKGQDGVPGDPGLDGQNIYYPEFITYLSRFKNPNQINMVPLCGNFILLGSGVTFSLFVSGSTLVFSDIVLKDLRTSGNVFAKRINAGLNIVSSSGDNYDVIQLQYDAKNSVFGKDYNRISFKPNTMNTLYFYFYFV